MFLLFGRAFGVHLSFPAWLLIMVVANMISAVPLVPSNIGAYEVAVAESLKALGIDAGQAGALAIASHIFNILWITGAGFVAMWALGLGFADVFSFGGRQRPEEVSPAPELSAASDEPARAGATR